MRNADCGIENIKSMAQSAQRIPNRKTWQRSGERSGVGPKQVIDFMSQCLQKKGYFLAQNTNLGGEIALLRDLGMARANRHYIPGYVWHTKAKKQVFLGRIWFNVSTSAWSDPNQAS